MLGIPFTACAVSVTCSVNRSTESSDSVKYTFSMQLIKDMMMR